MSTIYVTGASGCIGSQLMKVRSDIIPIHGDILTTDFREQLQPGSVLIHLAALSNIEESRKFPERYHQVNVEGTRRVADACQKFGVRLLFPSTVHVYGCPGPNIKESCDTLTAFSPYGASKIACEQYISSLGRSGLHYTIFRWPGVFGRSPVMHFDTTVHLFVQQAVQHKPITAWRKTMDAKRPHLYIGDAIAAIQFIVDNNLFTNNVFNVLTGNYTTAEIIAAIREHLPETSVALSSSPAANLQLDVDNTKICNVGCKPTGSLRVGIKEVIESLTPVL